jgi:hypothetical protein
MKAKKWIAFATMTVIAGTAVQPALAQGNGANRQNYGAYGDQRNENNYQDGYRAGYSDGRGNLRYDDNVRGNNRNNSRYEDRNDRNARNDRGDDRSQRWQQRYSRAATYNDDHYYQECR